MRIACQDDIERGGIATENEEFWYLAAPYSNVPRDQSFTAASVAAAWLIGNGVRVFSPITHSHPVAHYGGLDPLDLDLWLRVHKPFLEGACGMIILQIPGWPESRGIKAEVAEFARMGKPVHYMDWPIA